MTTLIKTNRQPRPVLQWYELTPKEQAEFDYLDTEDAQAGASFMRYRGWVYDLSEFMRAPADLAPWSGYHTDSAFSAVLIRFVDHGESVVAGLALS